MAYMTTDKMTSLIEEIKVLKQIIEGLKRNNIHLNYDIEKTRQWAIAADKELDLLKTENGKLNDDITVLKDNHARLEKELAVYKEQNARLHEILNGLWNG